MRRDQYSDMHQGVRRVMEKKEIQRVGLTDHVTGYPKQDMPDRMSPAMMRRLLGGKFPNTGFSWDMVYEFRLEGGTWEPYNCFDEILPANGFQTGAQMEPMMGEESKECPRPTDEEIDLEARQWGQEHGEVDKVTAFKLGAMWARRITPMGASDV